MLVHYIIPLMRLLMYFLVYGTMTIVGMMALYIGYCFYVTSRDLQMKFDTSQFNNYDDL